MTKDFKEKFNLSINFIRHFGLLYQVFQVNLCLSKQKIKFKTIYIT